MTQCLEGPLPTGELWKVCLSVPHLTCKLPSGPSQRHLTGDYSGHPAVVFHSPCLIPVRPGKVLSLKVLGLAPEIVRALVGFPQAVCRLLEVKFLHKLMLELEYVSRQRTRLKWLYMTLLFCLCLCCLPCRSYLCSCGPSLGRLSLAASSSEQNKPSTAWALWPGLGLYDIPFP